MMTEKKLQEIAIRVLSASPLGPECPEKSFLFHKDGEGPVMQVRGTGRGKSFENEADANYDFYFHAREDVLILLAELKAFREAAFKAKVALADTW
jgi:hypothetical protein